MNEKYKIIFVRSRLTGKFAKHKLAKIELEKLEKLSSISAVLFCFASLFNGCLSILKISTFDLAIMLNVLFLVCFIFSYFAILNKENNLNLFSF